MTAAWSKPTCAEMASYEMPGSARAFLKDAPTPDRYLDRLLERQQRSEAVRFLSHGLTLRRAIWWGCLCLRHGAAAPLPTDAQAALDDVVRWVVAPTHGNWEVAAAARILRSAAPAAASLSPSR